MSKRRHWPLLVVLAALAVVPGTSQALSAPHGGVVSADPVDTTPNVLDGKVTAILPLGGRVFVGGTFTQVQEALPGRPVLSRRGLFAFEPSTGAIADDFVADLDVDPDPAADRAVEALAASADGQWVFVAGSFAKLNGSTVDKLVKLQATTGAPDARFSVSVHSGVKDLAVAGNTLYLAGSFSTVNNQPRVGLAAVDATTGALDAGVAVPFTRPRQGAIPRVETIALSPDGSMLVAGGNFLEAGGLSRAQIAMVDVGVRPARLADWRTSRFELECSEPGFDTQIRDIDMSPDGRWFVVVTAGGYDRHGLCDAASRWETSARGQGIEPTWWDRSGGDSFTAVVATGSAVYVGGHLRWLNNNRPDGTFVDATPGPGAVPREGIAALDPSNGLPLSWNPGRDRGEGAWALVAAPDGLWVGSDTDLIGGEHHAKLAFLPLAGGTAASPTAAAPLPGDLYVVSQAGSLSRRWYDGSVVGDPSAVTGGAEWAAVRGAFAVGDKLYTGRDDGRLQVRTIIAGGAGYGPPRDVDLFGTPPSQFPITRLTGMFYDQGRLYHTVTGDRRLFYRWFTPESGVVGWDVFVAGGEGDGFDFDGVQGITVASGRLAYSRGGELLVADFRDGRPVPGTARVAGRSSRWDWSSLGLFVLPATSSRPSPDADGYWMVGSDGAVHAFGGAGWFGHVPVGAARAVDLEPTPSGQGYWVVDDHGHVFARGDASWKGDVERSRLSPGETVTSLSATRGGDGYWVFTSKGRVLPFGNAKFLGDMSATTLNGPVLDSIPSPSGRGYYMVASDGGIFAFGDAGFHGSMGGKPLNRPVESLVPDPDGTGYWLVASDGGVFAFDAPFRGSMGGKPLNRPVTGMVPFGNGYLMVGEDGGIFNFSDRPFLGSLGDRPPAHPVTSVAAR